MALNFIERWIEKGRIIGEREGWQRGMQKGMAKLITRRLKRLLGAVPDTTEIRLRKLPVEKLEELGEDLFDFKSLADFETWLKRHAPAAADVCQPHNSNT